MSDSFSPLLTRVQYIALERLESVYKSCNLVANICVYGDPNAKQPMAVIIPHEPNLRQELQNSNVGVDAQAALSELCHDGRVQDLVLKSCNAAGKKAAFKPMELLQAVVLTADEWTPENGILTAAQKVQRRKVAERYKDDIKVRRCDYDLRVA